MSAALGLVECPLCKGQGCVICNETGFVKQRNLDRAREPDDAGLLRLWGMLTGPVRGRRERTRQQRAWLEAVDPPSRLDWEDRNHGR
jgi:hypothetical protein